MSKPSEWPLGKGGVRILVPQSVLFELQQNPLSADCYPTALGFYPNAQSHQMRRVDHDDFLMMYCLDGIGDIETRPLRLSQFDVAPTEAHASEVGAGDMIVLPPGMSHHYAARPERPWSLFWCHFRGTKAQQYYDYMHFSAGVPIIKNLRDPALLSSFHSLISVVSSGYSLPVFVHIAHQLKQIITLSKRLRSRSEKDLSADSIAAVRTFMRENLHRRLSLDDFARVSELSRYHFNRKYKEITGYSPMQHFMHLKMEQACFLLDRSDMSISEIAFELGYEDPLYFSRVFRKTTGLAPSRYRQSAN